MNYIGFGSIINDYTNLFENISLHNILIHLTLGDDLTVSPTALFFPLVAAESALAAVELTVVLAVAVVLVTGFSKTHFSLESIN